MTHETDVVVIGMGPSGEHAAGRLAEAGLRVVAVEAGLVGKEWPCWAAAPSTMTTPAGHPLAETWPGVAGWEPPPPDFGPTAARIRREAAARSDRAAIDRFARKGGHFVRGRARLAGPGRVAVDGRDFDARLGIVLATGTRLRVPPIRGLGTARFWTEHDELISEKPPASLVVLGGGPVGLEHAQLFARIGTAVVVVEAEKRLLPEEEPEAGGLLADILRGEGVTVRTGARAEEVRHAGGSVTARLVGGEEFTAARLLVSTGYRADLSGLGLETVGLDPDAEALRVDEQLLAAPGLWGVGGVTGLGGGTHVALYQAEIAVRAILGEPPLEADYRALPRITSTDPEVGSVGMTERRARAAGLQVRTGVARVPSMRAGRRGTPDAGLIKLVVDAGEGALVGATFVGHADGEVAYGLAACVQADAHVDRLRHTIYAPPDFHRAMEGALAALA